MITLKSMEKVDSSWSTSLMSSKEMFLCLLSSQIPFSSPLEYFLKFVDAHHEFCKQEWLHVRMLEGLNFLTAWPTSFLFSRVMTNADRGLFSVPVKAITQKKNPCNNDKEMNEQVMVKSSSSCTVLSQWVCINLTRRKATISAEGSTNCHKDDKKYRNSTLKRRCN